MNRVKLGSSFGIKIYSGILVGIATERAEVELDENVAADVVSHRLYLPLISLYYDTLYLSGDGDFTEEDADSQ